MAQASDFLPCIAISNSTAALRAERAWLLARHDSGAISPGTFKIIRELETDISWAEYRKAVRS